MADSPTVDATGQPSPTSTSPVGRPLSVTWTEVAPGDTSLFGYGTMFLLNSRTGQIYSPTDQVRTDGPRVWISWGPSLVRDPLSLWMYPSANDDGWVGGFFVGNALEPMKRVPGEVPAASSRGIAATTDGGNVLLVDMNTGRELSRIPDTRGQRPGGWSWDGRYLALVTDGDAQKNTKPLIAIWDFDTRQTILELEASAIHWANKHNRFLYQTNSDSGRDVDLEFRIRDLKSGVDHDLGGGTFFSPSTWSPNDDYVIGNLPIERTSWFSIFDASSGRKLASVGGSWPMRWLDDRTIALLADVCTGATSLVYMKADGSDLNEVATFGDGRTVHPSPDGSLYAFSDWTGVDLVMALEIVDRATGASIRYETGSSFLVGHPWNHAWSPDGRFLILMSPVGKDGACMGVDPEPFQLTRHP